MFFSPVQCGYTCTYIMYIYVSTLGVQGNLNVKTSEKHPVFTTLEWSEVHLVSEHVQCFPLLSAMFFILWECKVTHAKLPGLWQIQTDKMFSTTQDSAVNNLNFKYVSDMFHSNLVFWGPHSEWAQQASSWPPLLLFPTPASAALGACPLTTRSCQWKLA